jgi:hypothetical protein
MNPLNTPKIGTHWAGAQGRKIYFYSRNPKAKSVIWHPRFLFLYRTSEDALIAKAHWEQKHSWMPILPGGVLSESKST